MASRLFNRDLISIGRSDDLFSASQDVASLVKDAISQPLISYEMSGSERARSDKKYNDRVNAHAINVALRSLNSILSYL